jgi:predicted MFS family arabinose efflux permease
VSAAILTAAVVTLAVFVLSDDPGQPAAERLPLGRVIRIPGVGPILFVIFAWMLGHTHYVHLHPPLPAGRRIRVQIEILLVVFVSPLAQASPYRRLRRPAPRTLVASSLAGFTVAGAVLILGHQSPTAIYSAVILWGLTFGGASPQLQRPLSAVSGKDADVANAFLPVAFNLAIFAAGILGAVVLNTLGGHTVPLTITVFGVIGCSPS